MCHLEFDIQLKVESWFLRLVNSDNNKMEFFRIRRYHYETRMQMN